MTNNILFENEQCVQENINPYDAKKFRKTFISSDIYKKLKSEYDFVDFENSLWLQEFNTPRAKLYQSRFSCEPFYFLDFLIKQNPEKIYDLGCGCNIFKKYIPNIIGIDDQGKLLNKKLCKNIDIIDKFDDAFLEKYQNHFESIYSICALHFINLSDLRKRCLDFISIVKEDGHGFLSLNLARMCGKDPVWKKIKESTFENYKNEVELYIRKEL